MTPRRTRNPTVLFFGRIWEYKGLEYLIRAEPLITAEVPNVKIVIAGEGEDFDRYRRLMVHPERFVVYNEYVSDDVRATLFQAGRRWWRCRTSRPLRAGFCPSRTCT